MYNNGVNERNTFGYECCNGDCYNHKPHNDNNNQHHYNIIIIIITHNNWLKPSVHGSNSIGSSRSSRESRVACSSKSNCPWHSSQCQDNCVHSSRLLAAIAPNLSPHEWAPRGEESREVRPPTQASPRQN